MLKNHLPQVRREGTFFNRGAGGGVGRGILEFFAKKIVALLLPRMD